MLFIKTFYVKILFFEFFLSCGYSNSCNIEKTEHYITDET